MYQHRHVHTIQQDFHDTIFEKKLDEFVKFILSEDNIVLSQQTNAKMYVEKKLRTLLPQYHLVLNQLIFT